MELMYEVGMGLRRGHAYDFCVTELACLLQQARTAAGDLFLVASSEHQTEDIARTVIAEEVDRGIRPEVQRQIAYVNYILHEAVVAPLNAVDIEGTSYAGPRGEVEGSRSEDDHMRGEDDDHLPPSG
ncbi:hypothetical protein M9H77_34859 [Catharanthus roseus]|uniref:Uncharacterized protein n=1 Tax=Catharanthus roseus TaxID=4058 RepID=A0ACB9ZP37_CATRO|nr:hypothetical protein M9H77_34859 [Catharanthus roseus]